MEGRAAARACLQSLLESEFLHKVVETFAARVALVGIGLITTVVVARVLGPEGRGLYAAAVAIGAIGVQLGNLGLHASNTYYVARERRLMPALLGNTLLVSLVLGGSTSTAAWLVFSQWPHLAPVDDTLLLLALAWIPCALAYMLMQNLLLGIQEVRAFNAVELATKTLAVGFIAALALMERVSVEAVLASGFVPLGLGLFWIWQRLKTHLDRLPTGSLSLFKESIQYGLRAYLAALFSFLVLRADLLMLSCMVGPEQTGCYSIAAAMADMVGMLPVVIGSILFPRLSALNDRSHKWRLARKAALATGGIMAGVVLIAGLLAQPVVHLMFGTAFFPAVRLSCRSFPACLPFRSM